MTETRDKIVDLANSVAEVEKRFWNLMLDWVPEEVKQHLQAAQKERLLALRALLDARIKHLESRGGRSGRAQRRPKKVKVE